jgi:autotransporter adhesin
MTSLVRAQKRKEAHNQIHLSRDKGKIRVIERSAEGHSSPSTKNLQGRNSTPASRTFTTLRRGNIKIFSIFRNSKSMSCTSVLYIVASTNGSNRFRSKLWGGHIW